MEKLKVGQRIELVQILTDGTYTEGSMIPGTIRPVFNNGADWVGILPNSVEGELTLNFLAMISKGRYKEVRPIGAMIIKKIKKLVRTP